MTEYWPGPVNPDFLPRHEENWLKATDLLAPVFSTCARRQFFAVVLAPNKRVVGIGYNGGPPGTKHCVDGGCPHNNDGTPSGGTYDNCIAQHAEAGALLWSDISQRQGGTLLVNGVPCFGCAKLIASSGVARVVFWSEPSYPTQGETCDFLRTAGLEVVPVLRPAIDPELKDIRQYLDRLCPQPPMPYPTIGSSLT